MADRTVTVKSSGGDYPSRNAALSGESTNLVTNTRILTIETYNFADTTLADTGTGYTVSSSYYIKITSPSSERHAGVWSDSKSRLVVASPNTDNGSLLMVQAAYTVVEWQQFEFGTPTSTYLFLCVAAVAQNVTIRNNILRYTGSVSHNDSVYGIAFVLGYAVNSLVYRNIIYGFTSSDGSYGAGIISLFYSNGYSASGVVINNNTVYGCRTNIYPNYNPDPAGTLKNNFAGAPTNIDYYPPLVAWASAKNITSDSTSPDGASYQGKNSYSSYFADYANKDFHLKSTDTVLKDAGDNLGSPYDVDIDGQTVTGTWDIGADEYQDSTSIQQESFRFRNDDGSESAATWKANQDTNITLMADTVVRLRMLLNATGDPASIAAQLEYRYKPSGGAFGSWDKVR